MQEVVIKAESVSKSFKVGLQDVQILKDVSLEVKKGDFVVIFGPSGCGKSTLLHTILGLEKPSSGLVTLLSKDIYSFPSEDEISDFRKRHIGVILQQANWITSLTVVENVCFPLLLLGYNKMDGLRLAWEKLMNVGMDKWASYLPTELSSGQQQKVCLARSLITNPEILIADEPTGNLDFKSGQELTEILSKLNNQGRTIVMVTHDLEYTKYAKTAVKMFDGKVIGVFTGKEKDQMAEALPSKRGV